MSYSQATNLALASWPDQKLVDQIKDNVPWKKGEAQGTVKVRRDALYRLRETWQIPSRVTLEGDGSYGRHYYTAACAEDFPDSDPLIDFVLPSAKLEALHRTMTVATVNLPEEEMPYGTVARLSAYRKIWEAKILENPAARK